MNASAAPLGLRGRAHAQQRRKGRRADRCAGGTRRRAPPGRAEPDRALGRYRELPGGRRVPIPVASNLGTVTIEFKKFGVGLAFTPTVLGDGLINLKIEPEVSQIDPTTVIRANGITIPSLIVRRANTTVELRDGQSFAIAGLLQSISQTDQKQLPWLGDVPVLGALARSAAYQKKETDLVIIVTPRLVRPARPGDVLRTPLDTTKPANDPEFFLLGQSEVTRADGAAHQGPLGRLGRRRSATSSTFPRESAMSRNNRLAVLALAAPPARCLHRHVSRPPRHRQLRRGRRGRGATR